MRDTKEAMIQSPRMDGGNAMDAVIDGRLTADSTEQERYNLLKKSLEVVSTLWNSIRAGMNCSTPSRR